MLDILPPLFSQLEISIKYLKKVIQTGLLFFYSDIKGYKQRNSNPVNLKIQQVMKKMRNSTNGTEVQKSVANGFRPNLQLSYYYKKLLFTATFLMGTIMVNAQSIEEQAEKAGNEAFGGAMIRNILIVAGFILGSFLFKSASSKNENKG